MAEETYQAHPGDYDAQMMQAQQLIRRGVDGDAREILQRAIEAHPEWAAAYALMARAAMVDPEEALRYADRALERDATCLPALLVVGEVYSNRATEEADVEKAEEALLKAAGAHPGEPGPHYRLGLLYRRTGRTEQAAESV